MATPQEKRAESLEVLRELQDRGVVAIRSADLKPVHRERTLKEASVRQNIVPFADFLAQLVDRGLRGKPVAKVPSTRLP